MAIQADRHPDEEVARRGQALYERKVKDLLEASDRGKFLVLDIETGDEQETPLGAAMRKRQGGSGGTAVADRADFRM